MAWLLAILLAQAALWVEFEVCQLDTSKRPPVAGRTPDHSTFTVRVDQIHAISPIRPKPEGLECVQLGSAAGYKMYVIGTREEIMRKLQH